MKRTLIALVATIAAAAAAPAVAAAESGGPGALHGRVAEAQAGGAGAGLPGLSRLKRERLRDRRLFGGQKTPPFAGAKRRGRNREEAGQQR